MTTTATRALELALELVAFVEDADIDEQGIELPGRHCTTAELRDEIQRGLASLRQQPMVLDDLQLHARLNREIVKHGRRCTTR